MGTSADAGRKDQMVKWSMPGMQALSAVSADGFCELMEVSPGGAGDHGRTEVIARFQSDEPILDGRPAAVRRKIGKGTVIKLGFWSRDDSFLRLFRELVSDQNAGISGLLPAGVQGVPRTDGSLFLVNTVSAPRQIQLSRARTDRLTGRKVAAKTEMQGYEIFWLE
jgi:hypothetical protein